MALNLAIEIEETEHECNGDAVVDIDICTDCGEHSGFCSICGGSECCGSGSYLTE